jgi:hypothetical protein
MISNKTKTNLGFLFLLPVILFGCQIPAQITNNFAASPANTNSYITGIVTTIAGVAGTHGSADGIGTGATFYNPYAITTDGANLYIADSSNSTIRKMVIATGEVSTLAGSAGVTGSADGIGSSARFNIPAGITTDGTNLYVSDAFNYTIRKIVITTAEVSTLAGTAGTFGSTDGTGPNAKFNLPKGIATDGSNLYIVDANNSTIRKLSLSTNVVTTIAGAVGSPGSADGTGNTARFNTPNGMTFDGSNLYIADAANFTIRKLVISTGAVTTFAGTAGSSGSADGTGTSARFSGVFSLTTDGSNLYISDTGNDTIRKIAIPTDSVTTLAGTGGSAGSADGVGNSARFNGPIGTIYLLLIVEATQ